MHSNSLILPEPERFPILGHLPKATNLLALLEECHREFGGPFALQMGFRYVAIFSSPQANKSILLEQADKLSAVDAFGPQSWMLGRGLARLDGESHKNMKKLLLPSFHRESLHSHATFMTSSCEKALNEWQQSTEIDAVQAARNLTLSLILKSLFGLELSQQPRLSHDLHLLFECLLIEPEKPRSFFRFVNMLRLPVPNLRRRLDAFFFKQIHSPHTPEHSTLALLKDSVDANGNKLSAQELRDQLLTFIVAGHDTTAMALAWSLYELAKHPVVRQTLNEELATISHDDLGSIRSLPYLNAVIKEVLRLHPPIAIGIRKTLTVIEIDGYKVPKNANVLYAPYLTHRHGNLWEDALSFKPERFLNHNPSRYAYLPFGAGQHSCIGMNLAMLELQMILVYLVKNSHWTIANEPKTQLAPTLEPGNLNLSFSAL